MIKQTAHSILTRLMPGDEAHAGSRFVYYHSIHDSLPRSMPTALFREHLAYLTSLNLDFVTHSEALERLTEPKAKPWIAIGFDDGYEDNHSVALPILQEYGARATFYVVSGQIGEVAKPAEPGYQLYEGYRMLSRTQVRELHGARQEIASHGRQHELHTQVLAQGRDLAAELRASRAALSDMIGSEVLSHSYPNGQKGAFSDETKAAVRRAGYLSSATTLWGRVDTRSDPFGLPRCEISAGDDVKRLAEKMMGKCDYLEVVHRARRKPTWSPAG